MFYFCLPIYLHIYLFYHRKLSKHLEIFRFSVFQPKSLIAAKKRNLVNIGLLLANFCYLQLNRLQVLKFKNLSE